LGFGFTSGLYPGCAEAATLGFDLERLWRSQKDL
jgi:hypothetical protein